MLEAYALISHESHGHHDTELAACLHRDEQVARAQQQLRDMIRDLLTEDTATGDLRDDVAPDELASYCFHALAAARSMPSKAAVRRLVTVILAGLHPRAEPDRQPHDSDQRRSNVCENHTHDTPHAHEHEHDGEKHSHAHTGHEHVEHAHEHDGSHEYPHAHEAALEDIHEHEHA